MGGLAFGDEADIPMIFKNIPVLPKIFPSKALDSIARCRFPYPSRHCDTKAAAVLMIFPGVSNKIFVLKPLTKLCQI